jgi:hypothetical protein
MRPRIFDQPMTGAQRQRRHRAKMAARRKLVTRTAIDPVDVDPVLARFAMSGAEISKLFGGLQTMTEEQLATLQQSLAVPIRPISIRMPRARIPS